jgi:SAM-dependent methyltransferase
MKCRHCGAGLDAVFVDLGFAPPSNAYLDRKDLSSPELYYPLKIMVCTECWLVQTEDYAQADQLFKPDYAYFSSTSRHWLDHAARYSEAIVRLLGLTADSFVLEVASNDGYLLKNFVARGIPCLGIEPTTGTAAAAEQLGIPVIREFFGAALAERMRAEGRCADLMIGNNVLAHVPDINDFVSGFKIALKPGGTVTFEFPHLLRLIEEVQFDTMYHEHYSYISLGAALRIFDVAGLRIFDVEELPTHGGSLRIYVCHADDVRPTSGAVASLVETERDFGLFDLEVYRQFQGKVDVIKDNLLSFLIEKKREGRKVAAYGAAAKGNTILNYAGVKPDLLPYVCDAAPSKQEKFLPGSHIPILHPDEMKVRTPDIVLILPWNIAGEITGQHRYVREWGGEFVVAAPELRKV